MINKILFLYNISSISAYMGYFNSFHICNERNGYKIGIYPDMIIKTLVLTNCNNNKVLTIELQQQSINNKVVTIKLEQLSINDKIDTTMLSPATKLNGGEKDNNLSLY